LLKPKILKASLWRGAQSALNLCAAKRRILLFSNRRFESALQDLNNQVAVKIFDFKSATYAQLKGAYCSFQIEDLNQSSGNNQGLRP